MEYYNTPSLETIKKMFTQDGMKLTPVGELYFKNNPEQMFRLYNRWLQTNPTSLSESFGEFVTSKSKNLYPNIVPLESQKVGLSKFEKPLGTLGKTASNITKGMRGVAHLIPIVGAGLTAADVYQGLNQPVGAANIPYQQQIQTASPFERERLMNINYFGR